MIEQGTSATINKFEWSRNIGVRFPTLAVSRSKCVPPFGVHQHAPAPSDELTLHTSRDCCHGRCAPQKRQSCCGATCSSCCTFICARRRLVVPCSSAG